MKNPQQIGERTIVIDGKEHIVQIFAPAHELRKRIDRARKSDDPLAYEREAEARAEARHLGIDLGPGYSAW